VSFVMSDRPTIDPPAAVSAAELDSLYGAPLTDFIRVRDELAAAMKAANRTDAAKATKALRKPSLPMWTLNQLARRHQPLVEKYLGAVADLKEAERAMLDGRGGRDAFHAASSAERTALAALTAAADALLGNVGLGTRQDSLRRVESSLRALAVADPGSLRRGHLTEEPASATLGFLGLGVSPRDGIGSEAAVSSPSPAAGAAEPRTRPNMPQIPTRPESPPPDDRSAVEIELDRRRREARHAEARRLAAVADGAEERATRLEAAARRLKEQLERATADAEAARREARDARLAAQAAAGSD
jgi:hypothetical protein